MKTIRIILLVLLIPVFSCRMGDQPKDSTHSLNTTTPKQEIEALEFPQLHAERAAELSILALHCIHREYPNKTGHVMNDESELWTPQEMHPAFYGCFDWHSSVHGHWMLIRLLKLFPDLGNAQQIREALDQNLSRENILGEVAYFQQEGRKSFERTYGWAWLLKLAEELKTWDDPQGQQWSVNLQPLSDELITRLIDFLPKQDYPIRTGVHPNTAFGITFALDYAQTAKRLHTTAQSNLTVRSDQPEISEHPDQLDQPEQHNQPDQLEQIDQPEQLDHFEKVLLERAKYYYAGDQDAPLEWEPGGEDFFSPSLLEASLMTRVLDQDEFAIWLEGFFPDLLRNQVVSILQAVEVSDRSDPKIVHLDGLNLSRAWCMLDIVNHLPDENPYKEIFAHAAASHATEALKNIVTGNYEGEHWLASFAVYLLSL